MERKEWRKTMKRNSLIGVDRVRFNDFSQYDSEKCNNGDCYGFWTNYDRLDNGTWKVSYGTTADFNYCPVCGCFNDHYEGEDCCYESGYSCGEYDTIAEKELLRFINEFRETEDKYIEYKQN